MYRNNDWRVTVEEYICGEEREMLTGVVDRERLDPEQVLAGRDARRDVVRVVV